MAKNAPKTAPKTAEPVTARKPARTASPERKRHGQIARAVKRLGRKESIELWQHLFGERSMFPTDPALFGKMLVMAACAATDLPAFVVLAKPREPGGGRVKRATDTIRNELSNGRSCTREQLDSAVQEDLSCSEKQAASAVRAALRQLRKMESGLRMTYEIVC